MSLKKAIQHNQSLVISAVITILCFSGIFACHLTQAQKKQIIDTAAITVTAAAVKAPLPWPQIGLAIGTLLGGGSIIDNRRKDVLIKRLKTEVANANKIPRVMLTPANNHPTVIPPRRDN